MRDERASAIGRNGAVGPGGGLLRKGALLPIYFILPSVILIAFVNAYPFISGLLYSIRDGTLLKPGSLVWFQNYGRLFQMPEFWNALQFSVVFAFFGVTGSYIIGLGLALLLNKDMPGRGFFRVALLVPWVLPSVVSIVGWRWMIGSQDSFVNVVLGWFGIEPILFLGTPGWAVFSVTLIKIWRSFPFMMISLLAAIQTINQELYESAQIDGANRWQSFRYITLPQLKTISVVCWILMTIWCFNDFDTIWLLTQGGPANATENLIVLAYKYTFTKNALGIGSAIAIVSLILLMALAALLIRLQREDD